MFKIKSLKTETVEIVINQQVIDSKQETEFCLKHTPVTYFLFFEFIFVLNDLNYIAVIGKQNDLDETCITVFWKTHGFTLKTYLLSKLNKGVGKLFSTYGLTL